MSDVVADRRGAVLVCRLNRPEARNGLTGALLGEYLAVLEEARTDDAVRVVVTTGEGAAFSAGADVRPTARSTGWVSAAKRWPSRTTTSHSLRQ